MLSLFGGEEGGEFFVDLFAIHGFLAGITIIDVVNFLMGVENLRGWVGQFFSLGESLVWVLVRSLCIGEDIGRN